MHFQAFLFALQMSGVVLFLGSCSSPPTLGDAGDSPSPAGITTGKQIPIAPSSSEKKPWSVPSGLFVPVGDAGKYDFDGLYSSPNPPIDPNCCWMEPNAKIRFTKAASATRVFVTVYVKPDVPIYRRKPPFIRIMLDGKTLVMRTGLPIGDSRIPIDLPAKYRGGEGPFTFQISTSKFVPAVENLNGDTRVLGLMLKRIETN